MTHTAATPAHPATPASTPTIQRSVTPTPAPPVRLRPLTPPSTTTAVRSPLPVARLVAPSSPMGTTPVQRLPIAPAGGEASSGVGTGTGTGTGISGGGPVVQRGFRSSTKSATGRLAASAAAAVAGSLERLQHGGGQRQQHRQDQEEVVDDPLPFPPSKNPEPVTVSDGPPPPGYTPIPEGTFDPKALTDFQIDELVHRMIGRITRLVRTELRMDRERIGRLRDDRR
ncbi:hypothetical protein [Streptomyces sp. NPDC059009]|uniref:hypothetical protein n=1 Tax=Streptomyces sp. NPDC059009 TaxID=3346694 RepID=UPI0036C9B6BA